MMNETCNFALRDVCPMTRAVCDEQPCLPACPPACLSTCLHVCLPTSICPQAYLPTCL